MDAAWAQVWVAAGIGVLQCGLIWYGIRIMGRASDQREQQLAENRTMMATLAGQTAENRTVMTTLAGQNATLAEQTAALRELLHRSEPQP